MEHKIVVIILIAVLAPIVIKILMVIFRGMTSIHIRLRKKRIFKDNKDIATKCRNLEEKLQQEEDEFNACIRYLGLNKVCLCNLDTVRKAEINTVKYLIKYSNLKEKYNSIEELEKYLAKLNFCISYLTTLGLFYEKVFRLQQNVKKQTNPFLRVFMNAEKVPYVICINKTSKKYMEDSMFPRFTFLYKSPAGRSRKFYTVKITASLLEGIREGMTDAEGKANFMKIQRSAMTNDLREAIKKRDNYTCCVCGNSLFIEPNLLLEVDHIIPVSKGGKTEPCNLQTLCWRCNRKKGNKINLQKRKRE